MTAPEHTQDASRSYLLSRLEEEVSDAMRMGVWLIFEEATDLLAALRNRSLIIVAGHGELSEGR
jgi:hypothetical protein